MKEFQIAYEAWATRLLEIGVVSIEETAHLARLKEACEAVMKLGSWHSYLNVGNNPRGLHYGVNFSFKVDNGNEPELSSKIEEVILNCGFKFRKGELTIFD